MASGAGQVPNHCPAAEVEEVTPAELLPQVYDELRLLAAAKLAWESPEQTLDATALVHEAWLKLASVSFDLQSRSHFLRIAATAMRQILVDRARAKRTSKRDGGNRVELADFPAPLPDAQLLALDDALGRLAATKPEYAKLVELRFFVGLTGDEAATALGVSSATGDRMWRYARAWLVIEIADMPPRG
jgi:RNA polymerase sigma factor (TIGR02999 family)